MLSKRSRPIFKKPLLLLSGDRKGLLNPDSGMSSPRTPLGMSIKPPRGWEMKDHEGVGLGIVAAMSSKAGNSLRIPVKDPVGGFVKVVNLMSGSNPNPISPLRKGDDQRPIIVAEDDEMELDCFSESEDYTCVISHDPLCRKKIVYYDGRGKRGVLDERAKEWEVFVSPQMTFRDHFPMSDFLKFCHLCRKILHGEDIYMYRGEKAFCSMECRYTQMVSDECTDKCGPEVSNPSTSAASPHSGDKIFFTGIVAA